MHHGQKYTGTPTPPRNETPESNTVPSARKGISHPPEYAAVVLGGHVGVDPK